MILSLAHVCNLSACQGSSNSMVHLMQRSVVQEYRSRLTKSSKKNQDAEKCGRAI